MKGRVILRYVGNRPEPEPPAEAEFQLMPPVPMWVFLWTDEVRKLAEAAMQVDPQFARYLRK